MNDEKPVSQPIREIPSTQPTSTFMSSGILLYLDQLLVAIGGWVFWLVISKFTSASQIGDATAIYSLAASVGLITQLGLEYPLLRLASNNRTQILSTALAVKLAITLPSLPLMVYVIVSLYGYPLQHEFVWISIFSVLAGSVSFVARFALLGISQVKYILIFEVIGTVIKFTSGYALVYAGYGSLGILVSFLFYAIVVGIGTLAVARRVFSFNFGNRSFFGKLVKEGSINAPSKLSRMLVLNLSVVMLASFGVAAEDIGVFYIATMVTFAAVGFASSIAFMVIPASASSGGDLTNSSTRIGLGLTAPIITALLLSPRLFLSLIGEQYAAGENLLLILALGIVPYIVLINAISQFNNTGKQKRIVLLGTTQITTFVLTFFLLVPQFGAVGAAYSILLGFVLPAILSVIWLPRNFRRYILFCIISICVGWAIGQIISNIAGFPEVVGFMASITVAFTVIILSKNMSLEEIRKMVNAILVRNPT